MIALIERYGGWIDPGSAGYADGRTLLHQMAGRGAMRVMKWLLDHNATRELHQITPEHGHVQRMLANGEMRPRPNV